MLRDSVNTVYSCIYMGQMNLWVIDVKTIVSVIAMVPMTPCNGDRSSQFFLLEKPRLATMQLGDVDNDTTVLADE